MERHSTLLILQETFPISSMEFVWLLNRKAACLIVLAMTRSSKKWGRTFVGKWIPIGAGRKGSESTKQVAKKDVNNVKDHLFDRAYCLIASRQQRERERVGDRKHQQRHDRDTNCGYPISMRTMNSVLLCQLPRLPSFFINTKGSPRREL